MQKSMQPDTPSEKYRLDWQQMRQAQITISWVGCQVDRQCT